MWGRSQELERCSEKRRRHREDEQRHRQGAEDDAESAREEHSLKHAWQALPFVMTVEKRPPPERTEQNEGDDEDDHRGREEEGLGNREVANTPESVGQRIHGRTVRSAICAPRSSSSTSKRPGTVASKRIRAVSPAATLRVMSYPWRWTWSATSELR